MQLRLLLKAYAAFRRASLGDFAAYKSAALTAPAFPELALALQRLDQPLPAIEISELRFLPVGSFGHAVAAFMDAHSLKPLTVSAAASLELSRVNLLAVRYPLLHDAFHVLLGFGTDLPGELGVWSFVAEQGYSPSFERAATLARYLYPCMAPSQREALHAARLRGMQLARRVPALIAQPLERYWGDPLSRVRQRLHIVEHGG